MRRLRQAKVQERLFVEEVLLDPLAAFPLDLQHAFFMIW